MGELRIRGLIADSREKASPIKESGMQALIAEARVILERIVQRVGENASIERK